MSKVLITKEKIDAIADKVIGLVGVTTNQTLDQLSALLTDINTEVEDQQEIISEISVAVDNLPDAGSGGLDTSDATATAGDILSGKIAYSNGERLIGTILTYNGDMTDGAVSGGSGGSSTTQQTCTVELDCGATEGYFTYYAVETLENGQWNLQNLQVAGATNLTLSNVICGGLIIFTYAYIQMLDVSTSSDAILVGSGTNIRIIKAPSTSGSHRIKIYDNF